MPREKPHYQETLVGIRARAAELYPGQLLFGPTKVAKLLANLVAGYGSITVASVI